MADLRNGSNVPQTMQQLMVKVRVIKVLDADLRTHKRLALMAGQPPVQPRLAETT